MGERWEVGALRAQLPLATPWPSSFWTVLEAKILEILSECSGTY
jgi:hypothetical protein